MVHVRFHIGKAKASRALEGFIPNPKLRLLDQVSEVMRFKHYSIRTETTYREWIKRFILFHGKRPDYPNLHARDGQAGAGSAQPGGYGLIAQAHGDSARARLVSVCDPQAERAPSGSDAPGGTTRATKKARGRLAPRLVVKSDP